jgi:hypothetical protein
VDDTSDERVPLILAARPATTVQEYHRLMRSLLIALGGLFLSATLLGCGASATIPTPPSNAPTGPPPGTSPEMAKAPKNPMGGLGGAFPTNKTAPKK